MPDLETVDLDAVEVLSVGGPVRAIGSPPEGDHYTTEQLRAMVDAARELGDELKAPARIGHRKMGETAEGALRVSPAVGWLTNQRLNADGTKLLADIKAVPKKFAELVKAGAFRTRSSELSRITSQRSGKTYDYVVSGLAWLGDKLPAVQTLDDVVALYEGDDAERVAVVIDEQEGDLARLAEANAVLVAMLAGDFQAGADTRTAMPESKFSEEQRKAFQKATGLDEAKVTDELMTAAGLKPETPDDGGDDDGGDSGDEQTRALEQRVKTAEDAAAEAKKAADAATEQLRLNERATEVEKVIAAGKEEPGRKAKLETMFDKLGREEFVRFYEDARVDEDLVREYGSDADGDDETPVEDELRIENELEEVFPGFESDRKEGLKRKLEATA